MPMSSFWMVEGTQVISPAGLNSRGQMYWTRKTSISQGPLLWMNFDLASRWWKTTKQLDDILCEQKKHQGPGALQWLLHMFLTSSKILKLWRQAKIVTILKSRKDPFIPKSFRPSPCFATHTSYLRDSFWTCRCFWTWEFLNLFLNKTPFEHAPFVDEHLIPEQAGFWPGKSWTGQLLNLPQFIEDDYEEALITGAAFVNLSTAYDTVNHRILVQKLFQLTKDARLINLIQNMLENRHFFVDLKGKVAQGGDRRMASHKVVSLPPCCSISTQMTSPYTQIQGVSCMLMTSAL